MRHVTYVLYLYIVHLRIRDMGVSRIQRWDIVLTGTAALYTHSEMRHMCITYSWHMCVTHSEMRHMCITHSYTRHMCITHSSIRDICVSRIHVQISRIYAYVLYASRICTYTFHLPHYTHAIYMYCVFVIDVSRVYVFIWTCCASKYMLRNAQYVALDLCTCKMWCVRIMRELNLARSYSLREALHLQIHT